MNTTGLGGLIVTIGVDTTALTNASKAMQAFATNGMKSATTLTAQMRVMGSTMNTVGKGMTTALTLPLAGIGVAAAKMSSDFEFNMTKIVGLVGISREQVDEWTASLKKLGPELGRTPAQLSDALYFITSAGLRGAEAMEVLTMSAKASVAGMGEVKVVADAVTSAMNAYGSENLSAAHAVDILTAAVREGKAEADQMAGAIGKVLPIASQMGATFDQVASAMAAMTRTGTDAQTSAVQLRQIFNSLQKPSVEAEAAMKVMGTSAAELRKTIRDKGLLQALEDITTLSQKYGDTVFAKVFPNIRAMTGAFDIMGENVEENRIIFEKLTKVTGDMEYAFLQASDTLKVKWQRVVAQTQSTLIDLGDSIKTSLLPVFEGFISTLKSLQSWWTSLSEVQQQNRLKWLALIAIMGPTVAIVGTLINALSTIIIVLKAAAGAAILFADAILMNPLAAFVTALSLVFVWMAATKRKTDEATASQKEFNKATEGVKKLVPIFEQLGDLQSSLHNMNIRQVQDYISALETQKAAEEDVRLDAIAQQRNVLAESEQYQQALLDLKTTKANTTNEFLIQAAEDWLSYLRQHYTYEEQQAIESTTKQLGIIDKYIADATAKYEELQKLQKTSGAIVDPAVVEITQQVAAAEHLLAEKVRLLGKEYVTADDYLNMYMSGMEDMINLNSTQATPFITKWAEEIKKWQAEIKTGDTLAFMDELNEQLTTISNQGKIYGEKFDMATPSINAITGALDHMASIGIISGEAIDILKNKMAEFKAMLPPILSIQEEMTKAIEDSAFMEKNFGTEMGRVQGEIQARIQGLSAMRESTTATTDEINAQVTAIQNLQATLQKLEIDNIIVQNLAQSFSQLGVTIGAAFANGENMADAIISSLLQMVQAMLSATMVAVIMHGGIKQGLVGVLFAASVGLGVVMAMYQKSKMAAKGATAMAEGGRVPPGYNNDTFPAMLSSNETVIPLDRLKEFNSSKFGGEVTFKIGNRELIGTLNNEAKFKKSI